MAASSVTDICNMALTQIGVDLISDVTEETLEARLCNARYEDTRDACLRAQPWNFATVYTTLATTATTPAWRYTYQYELPADCLRVIELGDLSYQYELAADRKLLTNCQAPLSIKYTKKVTDVTLMDESFKQAWATLLASELTLAISKDGPRARTLYELYREKMADARFYGATERGPEHFQTEHYLGARQGGPFNVPSRTEY
jgi:hypothetical protein